MKEIASSKTALLIIPLVSQVNIRDDSSLKIRLEQIHELTTGSCLRIPKLPMYDGTIKLTYDNR